MTQNLNLDKGYWLERNPNIEFENVTKAYFGDYLLKAKLNIMGASIRMYDMQSLMRKRKITKFNYNVYFDFLCDHFSRYGKRIDKITSNRYITVSYDPEFRVPSFAHFDGFPKRYDARLLYRLHNMFKNPLPSTKMCRQGDFIYLYSNSYDDIEYVIASLGVNDRAIASIGSPQEANLQHLQEGKEINMKAKKYSYKVFLKTIGRKDMDDLLNYLTAMENAGEVEVPQHCRDILEATKDKWFVDFYRPYFYVKEESMLIMIKLLAQDRYSSATPLVMPENDK